MGALALAGLAAQAKPVLSASSAALLVGDSVVYTISDDKATEGFNPGLGYLADLTLAYDSAVLQFSAASALTLSDPNFNVFTATDIGSQINVNLLVGNFGASAADPMTYVTALADVPPGLVQLFTLTFTAIHANSSSLVELAFPANGAYGVEIVAARLLDTSKFVVQQGGGTVPEPTTWPLLLAAGWLAPAVARRVARRAR